jgi:hypothetical protein
VNDDGAGKTVAPAVADKLAVGHAQHLTNGLVVDDADGAITADEPRQARDFSARQHGQGRAVVAPEQLRGEDQPDPLVLRQRLQDPFGATGSVDRSTPDPETRPVPPVEPMLVQRFAGRIEDGPSNEVRRHEGPGDAAAGRVEQPDRGPPAVVRSGDDDPVGRTGRERLRLERELERRGVPG